MNIYAISPENIPPAFNGLRRPFDCPGMLSNTSCGPNAFQGILSGFGIHIQG
jgi:hypothetical protein